METYTVRFISGMLKTKAEEEFRVGSRTAESINCLGGFCGKRDIRALTPEKLKRRYGIEQADVMVLFGGSILCGGDVLAQGMRNNVAKKYVIVGGEGHTTETLRRRVHEAFPEIETAGRPEAEVFAAYLQRRYGLHADFLECRSTNCGNNITNLLELLEREHVDCRSIILSQDAAMQCRMEAGLRKYRRDWTIINYATYAAVVEKDSAGVLRYTEKIEGMWKMERYVHLLMGEIPRLTDDENGYGPKGKDYIAHVEIPPEVAEAFEELKCVYGDHVREADPRYGSAG